MLQRSAWWLLTWTGAGSLAIALSAIQLLPAIELLPQITRVQEITAHFGEEYDLVFRSGREFLKRCVSLAGPQNFSGTPAESVGAWGVLWTSVALAALLAVRRKAVWLYAGLLLLAVLFSFNTATPLYPLVRQYVPGFSLFRIPTRLLLFAGFPLGMLAGFLTEELFSAAPASPPDRARRQMRTGLVLLAVAAGFLALSIAANWQDRFRWWPYWKFIAFAAPVLAAVVYCFRSPAANTEPRTRMFPAYALWVALLTADLWYLHSKYLVTRSPDELFPSTEVVEFLKDHPGDYRVVNRNVAGPGQSPDALTQPLCILNRIDWVFGTNPTDLASYRQFLHFIGGRDDPPRLEERVALPESCDERLLDLLGARYLIVPADAPLSADEESSWSLVRKTEHNRVLSDAGLLDLPPQNIFERTSPLPRAFVVSHGLPAPPRSELLHALQSADLRRTVFLDRPGSRFEPTRAPEPQSFSGPDFQEARIVSRRAERVVIEIERTEPGYLVLLEAWYPGWRCRMAEGSELPVYRANSFFQAVEVPAGQHLEFVFEPRSYHLGRWISLTTTALLACFLAATFVRSRNRKERQKMAEK